MFAWYRSRWQATKVGTILATVHFTMISLLIALISISPSKDWAWWPIFPFVLDFPAAYVINFISTLVVKFVLILPHTGFEKWLLSQREPFSSLNLFWAPTCSFLVLGTIWHYYWPLLLKRIFTGPSSTEKNTKDGHDDRPNP